MAHFAFDIDGSIDAYPRQMQSMMSALQACGHQVSVVTGNGPNVPGIDDMQQKKDYLQGLGCGACYDNLVLINGTAEEDTAQAKADWCRNNGVDCLVDNNKANAKACSNVDGVCVLVPWASRE